MKIKLALEFELNVEDNCSEDGDITAIVDNIRNTVEKTLPDITYTDNFMWMSDTDRGYSNGLFDFDD